MNNAKTYVMELQIIFLQLFILLFQSSFDGINRCIINFFPSWLKPFSNTIGYYSKDIY